MRLEYLSGDDLNRIAREISDDVATAIGPAGYRLLADGYEPMQVAAILVAGLVIAVGDGMKTQAVICGLDWSPDDIRRLHEELQAAVHKAQMEIHARVNGGTN